MNKLLIASLALAATGVPAIAKAADMPVKYSTPAQVVTWTGCYVGAHVGFKWGTSRQSYGGLANGSPNAFLPVGFDMTGDYKVNGPLGGAQAGCNYQTGAWVWGIEVDNAWASASGQATPTAAPTLRGINTANFLFTTNERWLATARGRFGYAADKWLWYVTAGAAWSGFDLNNYNGGVTAAGNPAPGGQRQPTRINQAGWVVGVGAEYALLGGWSVKNEFLYANFGTMHYGDEPGIVNGCTAGCVNADVKMYEYIWRAGLNYRFDWGTFGKGKSPVVANY